MRIFVTGGTGFIGTHVIKKLQQEGHDLLLLSPEKLSDESLEKKAITGTLADIGEWKNEIKKFQPDTAIHMAWQSIPNYDSKTSTNNLMYGLDLIATLADIRCKRIICTGSCWEYGQQHGRLDEDMPLKPFNAFSAAKNALHWLGREIAKEKDMQFIWTRLFYVYGPGQKKTSLIPYIINCVQKGKEPEIKTPLARNDFVYVGDVAEAISSITKNCTKSAAYNIGSGHSTSLSKIVKIIYDHSCMECPNIDMRPKQDKMAYPNFWADISKIKKDAAWQPKINIKRGINKTIESFRGI